MTLKLCDCLQLYICKMKKNNVNLFLLLIKGLLNKAETSCFGLFRLAIQFDHLCDGGFCFLVHVTMSVKEKK